MPLHYLLKVDGVRLGTPGTVAFDLNQFKTAASVSASDIASSDIGSSGSPYLGSSGSQALANTLLTQQDNHLPTLAARS